MPLTKSPVLAAQVLHGPIVAGQLEREVLAREAGIVGKTELDGTGSGDRQTSAGEGHGFGLAVGILNENCAGHAGKIFWRANLAIATDL
jgi:hypothetical protein